MTAPEKAAPIPADVLHALGLLKEAKALISAAFRRSVLAARPDLNAALENIEAVRVILASQASQEERIREDERSGWWRDRLPRRDETVTAAAERLYLTPAYGGSLDDATTAVRDAMARERGADASRSDADG